MTDLRCGDRNLVESANFSISLGLENTKRNKLVGNVSILTVNSYEYLY